MPTLQMGFPVPYSLVQTILKYYPHGISIFLALLWNNKILICASLLKKT